ncbi:hypothetical protein evm_013789 [Chilo suppressalis]|nr:hypothetical protein evm_013789 [Chilo suppressalis]
MAKNDNEGHRSPTPVASPYSPLTSPPHREDRERSRSSIRLHQSEPTGVVVRTFDEDAFLSPDAHLIFESVYVVSDVSERRRNGRRGKDICIDESLTLWKGRLDIKQYIRSKASKFGIKTFELCKSVTGYLWSFILYAGSNTAVDVEILKAQPLSIRSLVPYLIKNIDYLWIIGTIHLF